MKALPRFEQSQECEAIFVIEVDPEPIDDWIPFKEALQSGQLLGHAKRAENDDKVLVLKDVLYR